MHIEGVTTGSIMTSWKKFFFLHFVLVLVELLFGCRERTCWSMNAYWFFVHYSFKSMRKQFLFNKPTKQENKILFKYDKNTEGDGKNQFSFAISNRVKDVHQILNTQQKELQFYRSRFTFSSLPFWNFSKSLRVYRRRWGDAINRTPAYANGNKCFTDAKRKMFILLPTCHCLTLATAILAILKWKMKNEWRKEQFANGIAIDIRRNFINLAAASRFVRVLFFFCFLAVAFGLVITLTIYDDIISCTYMVGYYLIRCVSVYCVSWMIFSTSTLSSVSSTFDSDRNEKWKNLITCNIFLSTFNNLIYYWRYPRYRLNEFLCMNRKFYTKNYIVNRQKQQNEFQEQYQPD